MTRSRARAGFAVLFFVIEMIHPQPNRAIQPSLELTQMLTVAIGGEIPLGRRLGVRGNIGASPFGPTCVSYALSGVGHLRKRDLPFQVDVELGMPLAYVDLIEDRYVDWNDKIDSPYAGWLIGGVVAWGYRRPPHQYSLTTGLTAWWEWQKDGTKGPRTIPIVAFRFGWGIR